MQTIVHGEEVIDQTKDHIDSLTFQIILFYYNKQ